MVLVSKIEGDNTENTQWINNRVIKYARVYLVMMIQMTKTSVSREQLTPPTSC